MKGDVIHAYLDYIIAAIEKQLKGVGSLNKDMSGESTSVIDPKHCINKSNLWSGSNDVNHISQAILNSLD
jgi:hypothetical protein